MTPHVHMSPVQAVAMVAFTIAVLGTLHLLALTKDNRVTRAFISMGF